MIQEDVKQWIRLKIKLSLLALTALMYQENLILFFVFHQSSCENLNPYSLSNTIGTKRLLESQMLLPNCDYYCYRSHVLIQ